MHGVLEGAQFLRVVTIGLAKVALRRRSVLGHGLWAEARSGVVSLMLVEFLLDGLARGSLRQGPPGHRPLVGGVCRVLWGVTARSD